MKIDLAKLRTVLVTDCGSTTTKALLFELTEKGWRQTFRGEAPTTVEDPVADVTVGALNAFTEIQELSGRKILSGHDANPFEFTKQDPQQGIDLYLSTSSAGGGLQMMVAGVVRGMSAESAERAALGAGAIVLEILSADDQREDHQRIERIRHIKPDIVLLAGGTDKGASSQVVEFAEILLAAAPRPRFGETLKLPVIFAGNQAVASEVESILSDLAQVKVVENVRPELGRENLLPAREAIHDFFLTHVMSHSHGYNKLLSWTPVPVMPTPAAVGIMIENYGRLTNQQVLCADIGGATTDVFSVCRDRSGQLIFNRSVSANYGMSYSIANVLIDAGVEAIIRWLPYKISAAEVRDRMRNKMIRPTSIPQTLADLWLEQAVCREALRLSLAHHKSLAVGLSGVTQQRSIADIFQQDSSRYELLDMLNLDMVIGSGGVLSHAPDRMSAALMMLDGFGLQGITEICVDSIFMMPHLGVFSSVHPEAAKEIFNNDCLVHICHAIVAVSKNKRLRGALASVEFNGQKIGEIVAGKISTVSWQENTSGQLKVTPLQKSIDLGAGPGSICLKQIATGKSGFILDGRLFADALNDENSRCASQMQVWETFGLKVN